MDIFLGVILGGVIGAIVAVNFVIYTGVEGGYEASIGDVFDHNLFLGLVTVAIWIGGPILGVVVARRRRRRRTARVA
jgi:hypothetical protein